MLDNFFEVCYNKDKVKRYLTKERKIKMEKFFEMLENVNNVLQPLDYSIDNLRYNPGDVLPPSLTMRITSKTAKGNNFTIFADTSEETLFRNIFNIIPTESLVWVCPECTADMARSIIKANEKVTLVICENCGHISRL